MKRGAKLISMTGLALVLICALTQREANAQDREKYIISAKAGGINLVSGNVRVQRKGQESAGELTSSDELESGDRVLTGWAGRVEVLLNPGSYMRVDENSEVELADASLDTLRIKLIKGSAVVEVAGADGVRFEINIDTPHTSALIVRSGIYRFSIPAGERTEIFVRKGRLFFGTGLTARVKDGQKVVINGAATEVAKFDKKSQDAFDLWSKERARTLAHANSKLKTRSLVAAMDDYHSRVWMRGGLNFPGRYYGMGLWIYNSRLGGYCFLPLGGGFWSSPYGYDYPTRFWYGGYNPWGGVTAQGNNYPRPGTGGNDPTGGGTGGNPPPAPAPAPAPGPTWTPQPSRPINETPVERSPRKVFTDGSPNR